MTARNQRPKKTITANVMSGTMPISTGMSKRDRLFILDTITTCARLGVSEITVGDLHVKFGRESAVFANNYVPEENSVPKVDPIPGFVQPGLFDETRQLQTLLDDPLQFENDIINEHMRQGATA